MSHNIRQQQPLPTKKMPNTQKTPMDLGQTVRLVSFITNELRDKIKVEAKNMFGDRKGATSLYMEQAMRVYLHMHVEGVTER